jgi:serine/threonine protein kinase
MSKKRIGQVLLEAGLVTESQIEHAIRVKQTKGGKLGEILIGLGVLTEEDFQKILSQHFGFPYFSLGELLSLPIHEELLAQVPYDTALQYLVLPHRKDGNTLEVVSLAPLSKTDERLFRSNTHTLSLRYGLATRTSLQQSIRAHYGRYLRKQSTEKHPSPQTSQKLLTLRQEGHCIGCSFPLQPNALHCTLCGAKQTEHNDPLVGRIIGGNWTLTRQLGEGGMGLVYEGQHRQTKQTSAIKFLRTQIQKNDAVVQRFQREVEILKKLKHPGIIEVYESAIEDGLGFYLAMELLEGCTFADYLESHGPILSNQTIQQIMSAICDAMAHAHQQGVIHRDLKPENVFLVGAPHAIKQIKILDFGIAKLQEQEQNRLTQTGMTLGTPHYISPEQAIARPVDERTDIYALSVILFELLTGDMLFDAESPFQYLMRHVYAEPRTLSQARPDLSFSPQLEALVAKGLSKRPEDRPDSMLTFKQLLQGAFQHTTPHIADQLDSPTQEQLPTADFSETQRTPPPATKPNYLLGADEWDDEPEPEPPSATLNRSDNTNSPLRMESTAKPKIQPPESSRPILPQRAAIRGAVWEDAHKRDQTRRLFWWFLLILLVVGGGTAAATFPLWKHEFLPTENEIRQAKDRWAPLRRLPTGRRARVRKKRRNRRRRRRRRRRRKRR